MIIKQILLCLLLYSVADGGPLENQTAAVATKRNDAGTACLSWYAPSLTMDNQRFVGEFNDVEYTGPIIVPDSNVCVCAFDIEMGTITGTLTSSHDFYVRIYTLDASYNITDTIAVGLGTSSKINGDGLVANEWLSDNVGIVTFTPCVEILSGSKYGFAIFPDQDGAQDDDPEVDGSNFPYIRYDNEANIDAISIGWGAWKHSDGTLVSSDAEDDVNVIIYTEQ